MTFPKTLRLVAWAPTFEGEGDKLKLELQAFRESKNGRSWNWRGNIRLEVDRHFVRQFSLAVEQMQKRDRERLGREMDRLAYEVAPADHTTQGDDMKTATRHNEPWRARDLRRMRQLADKGMPARLAALKLGRTPGAVKFKAMVEGVRFHAIEQPRGVQRRPAQRRKLARLRKARAA